MTKLTTQQHYEVAGGTLKVTLTTDHALTPLERDELGHIADACQAFQEHERCGHPASAVADERAGELDEAIWELGGDQAITAG